MTNRISSFWRLLLGGKTTLSLDHAKNINETKKFKKQGQANEYDDHLTPAEKRYLQ